MSSILFRKALSSIARPVARRNITTTSVKRSSDPLIGHIEQEARVGAVNIHFFKDYFNHSQLKFISFKMCLIEPSISNSKSL